MALKTFHFVPGLSRTPLLFFLDISPTYFSKIRRPLFRGATRLRRISSILYPVSSVSFILHPGFFVSLYSCMVDVALCILHSAASNLAVDSAALDRPVTTHRAGTLDLGLPQGSHENSSNFKPIPGHQKSNKLTPRPPKDIRT